MFDFLNMKNDYKERKVDNFKNDKICIDTCYASDTGAYETGIESKYYNNGNWVIVQEYESKEEAIKGHQEWIEKMTIDELPAVLMEVSTCKIAKLSGNNGTLHYKKIKE